MAPTRLEILVKWRVIRCKIVLSLVLISFPEKRGYAAPVNFINVKTKSKQ